MGKRVARLFEPCIRAERLRALKICDSAPGRALAFALLNEQVHTIPQNFC